MNAKTVKKILMRGRGSYLFGRRAWLTIRVDPSALPERPALPHGMAPTGMIEGRFVLPDGSITEFVQLSGACKPPDRAHFAVEHDGWWEWWEIDVVKLPLSGEVSTDQHVEWLKAYMTWKEWEMKWIHGMVGDDTVPAHLHHFFDAVYWSKTLNFERDKDGSYLIQFVVKWFYPMRRLKFSSSFARWTKDLDRLGIKFRVLKPVS